MKFKIEIFLAAAAVAVSTAAVGQTTPSSSTPSAQPRTPDEPSATAPAQTTTSGQAAASAPAAGQTTAQPAASQVVAATAVDVKAGVAVYDSSGGTVGKIESVSGTNAVLSTGATRAQVPISSLGKNDKGLVISMTKAQIDAQAKKSSPKPK